MKILFFGALTDITQATELEVAAMPDTEQLLAFLTQQYPALKESAWVMAVDQQLTHNPVPLLATSEIAFLPPFSGG